MLDEKWIDERLADRRAKRTVKRQAVLSPETPRIDVSLFVPALAKLAQTMTNLVEREGEQRIPGSPIPADTGVILRLVTETYNLLCFVNADETRNSASFRKSYTFVSLPLVRTMLDGFYNCTALLDDPSRSKKFRISGLWRKREALRDEEKKHLGDPTFAQYLGGYRDLLESSMRQNGVTDADLDDKKNTWPLLGTYLDQKPSTPHRDMIRTITHGFWKEYSSISHASYDGLADIFPFIAEEKVRELKKEISGRAAEMKLSLHYIRASGILLCLLTELQYFYKFDSANVDKRLSEIWSNMLTAYEIKELYDLRYREMLRVPLSV